MRTIILLFIAFAFFACEEDQPQPPIPDCYDPMVLPSLLQPNTNACMTAQNFEFTTLYPGGSTPSLPALDSDDPYFNTYTHTLHFDSLGLYYIVRQGDTVQSGRVLLQEITWLNPVHQNIELVSDCVENIILLQGIYDMNCTNTGMFIEGYYPYGTNPNAQTRGMYYSKID